jgi:hypothetical protein
VLLLHNYPFHRHAAYLAQVFPHVFVDVGLATHNSGALSVSLLRETLELAPFGKLLFSSDAFGLAELYHLGGLLFRRGLTAVLGAAGRRRRDVRRGRRPGRLPGRRRQRPPRLPPLTDPRSTAASDQFASGQHLPDDQRSSRPSAATSSTRRRHVATRI